MNNWNERLSKVLAFIPIFERELARKETDKSTGLTREEVEAIIAEKVTADFITKLYKG